MKVPSQERGSEWVRSRKTRLAVAVALLVVVAWAAVVARVRSAKNSAGTPGRAGSAALAQRLQSSVSTEPASSVRTVSATQNLAADRPAAAPSENENTVHVQVEHCFFHPTDDVTLQVERLNGRMVGKPGHIISLDDRNSYAVEIDQGVTRLSAHDLTALINSYLLRHAESAVRKVEVSFDGQQMVIKGKVHRLIDLPFEGRGTLSATPQGELRLHMQEYRVAGMLSKGFLDTFGVHMQDVAKPKHTPSFRVEGDDFISSLTQMFPPPLVYGRLSRVKVDGQQLVQVIGIEAEHHAVETIPKALPEPPNYIYFTAGRMRFGRVTMDNVDLKLVNRTPKENFDFSLQRYQEQIEGGYVKVLPSLGLIVYAEDFSDLKSARR